MTIENRKQAFRAALAAMAQQYGAITPEVYAFWVKMLPHAIPPYEAVSGTPDLQVIAGDVVGILSDWLVDQGV